MLSADLLLERAITFIPVLLSLTVHEWAHAWTAWKLGDDTAKMLGRVSLNPLDHIDPVGTLLLPLLGIPFGWAKPVPFNPTRFRTNISMPLGMGLTVAAGPISNIVLAAFSCLALASLTHLATPAVGGGTDPRVYLALHSFFESMVFINILLACFNMLPIPPLDGSRIVEAILPDRFRPLWNSFTAISPVFLLLVILLPSVLGVSILAWPLEIARNLVDWVTAS